MPYVSGFLIEGPVDPGFGRPGGGNRPDNSLPGDQPGIDNSLPIPPAPPGIWPPPSWGRPIVPVNPPGIDNSLPVTPGTIWPPPGRPPHISTGPVQPPHGSTLPLPGGGRPDQGLPEGPSYPDNSLPSQTYWMLCYTPTLGWKFVAVDPSLEVGYPLPPAPEPK